MRIQGHCQWHEPLESIMGDTRPYLKKQNLNQNQIKTFHFKLKPNKNPMKLHLKTSINAENAFPQGFCLSLGFYFCKQTP